jgi:hypothetical protein
LLEASGTAGTWPHGAALTPHFVRGREKTGMRIFVLKCRRPRSNHEGTVEKILRWFAPIIAAFKKPAKRVLQPTVSDTAAETRADGGGQAAAAALAKVADPPTATATRIDASAADARMGEGAPFSHVAAIPTDRQEIERRRELVRALFNDFWSGSEDKPAAFVDRLDQAEAYLNERLAACGERWQLDVETRKVLGLPARSNSHGKEVAGLTIEAARPTAARSSRTA